MKQGISILGSGWLSLPLAQHLQRLSFDINISTRDTNKQQSLQQQGWKNCYIIDIDKLHETDKSNEFFNTKLLIIAITNKSLNAFEQLLKCIEKSRIEKVLFISSSSVYQTINGIVTENKEVENAQHPLHKIEQLLQSSPSFETTVLRLSGLIGPNRHPGRFFKNGKIVMQADAPVNLIHLDDCIGIIEKIIQQQVWGEVFNGCADTHPSKREFYSHARQQLQQPLPEFSPELSNAFKIVSNQKVKHYLNYSLKHPDLLKIQLSDYSFK